MQIRETFATAIQKRIEPVVKVGKFNPQVMLDELRNLVVTPQWERYFRTILDTYSDAATRDDEQSIGIWVSGFFGSGKSLLIKVLGALLENPTLAGQAAHEVFLERIPASSQDRASIKRYLDICKRTMAVTVAGGNLHTMQAHHGDPLVLIVFRLFAQQRDYTHLWPFAWAVEYQIDTAGKTFDFRQRAEDLSGADWEDIKDDPTYHYQSLCRAAAELLPNNFPDDRAVDQAVNLTSANGLTPTMLIDRLRKWCEARDGGGRRHKLLLQLDELGQWLGGASATTERAQQVQALAETAATNGRGRIWIAVTAHGDIQALRSNLLQEQFAKINQRFANTCKLSNEDISQVVEQRILRKTQEARLLLQDRFTERSGDLTDLGTISARREYPAPTADLFGRFYPYLPWTVAIIPDVVKGISQAIGQEDALSGANRTMIGVVQGAIIETPGLLEDRVGRLLALADLYDQLTSDAPIETKTDLSRVHESVPDASDLTTRVARALYLLGAAEYVDTTVDAVARALVSSLDTDLVALKAEVRHELERLVGAGFAKQVGEQFSFLSTQQRGFQDRVRARQEELQANTYELSQALKEFEGDDVLRFDRVALHGREILLKLEVDGRVTRNPAAAVTLRVYSQFQRTLDPQIGQDDALKQRSNEEPNAVLIRLDVIPELRRTLALALATDRVARETDAATTSSDPDKQVARQAISVDLPAHKAEVRRMLALAVRKAQVFFRGTSYAPLQNEAPGAALRALFGTLLPQIFPRFSELTHRIANEETAVKAALNHNLNNADLREMGVFRADGQLNQTHALISALRARLPVDDQFQQYAQAAALRT